MHRLTRLVPVVAALLLLAGPVMAGQIFGDYVEARSADVYTGPCVANAEVNLSGNQATLAWKIRQGEWNGVALDGLSIIAVAKANATLGDPFANPYTATAVLIVDQRATEDQKCALIEFAKAKGGRLLENVVLVQSSPISMEVGENEKHGAVVLQAGKLARIATRPLGDKDHLCGNESTYYTPLTELSHAMAVYTLADEYLGRGLDSSWRLFDKRSAFVGTFSH
jgi:hypothetical protein